MSDGLLRMLKPPWEEPGDIVCDDPGQQHHGDPDEPQNHAGWPKIVRPKNDVVHIALKACQRNQRYVDHDKADESDENKEVDRARSLPAAEDLRIQREAVHQGRRHRHTGEDRQRSHDENRGEVGKLLQSVVTVKAVRLRREVEVGIKNKGVPCLHEDSRGGRHQPFPLRAGQKADDEEDTRQDKAIDRDEVPGACNANRMAVARSRHQRREIAGVVLCRPDAVLRHFERREADPLCPRSAMVVPVKSRMIHQDREPAADEHEQEEKVGEVTPANPEGKAMRSARSAFGRSRGRCNMWQAEDRMLQPCQHQGREEHSQDKKAFAR